jgi:hypothetical protein
MFGSILPCPSLRFPILPAQSCRNTARASPRFEGSTALALRCLNMRTITREAVLCLQTGRTLRSSATAAMSPSRWPRSPFRETVHRHPAAGRRTTTIARYIHSVKAFDCHAFDGIRRKGASRLRQTQHFSKLSDASARPDARPQGAAAIHACQERQSGIISA